jgi:hypothetical protein
MRSSSSCLAVSRSEVRVGKLVTEPFSGEKYTSYRAGRRVGADDHSGLDIHISVSYKTLLIVFALFTVAGRTLNLVIDTFIVQ